MNTKSLLMASVTVLATLGLPTHAAAASTTHLDCTDDSRGPHTITYGITGLFTRKTIFQVAERVEVKKGERLVFRLKPKGNASKAPDFEDAVVSLRGKAGSEWFTLIQGSYNGTADKKHTLGICVTAEPGSYEYEVVVEGFGTLDPRVIVEQ